MFTDRWTQCWRDVSFPTLSQSRCSHADLGKPVLKSTRGGKMSHGCGHENKNRNRKDAQHHVSLGNCSLMQDLVTIPKFQSTARTTWWEMERPELSLVAGGQVRGYAHLGGGGGFSQNYTPTLWFKSHVLCCLPKWSENPCPKKTCTWVFIADLFTGAQTWNEPRGPPAGEQIINSTETSERLALKRDALSSHGETWGQLGRILLSEESQSEKAASSMTPTLWHFGKGKTMATVKRSVVGTGLWGDAGGAPMIFRALEQFCTIHWWGLCQHTFVKIHRMNPNVNGGLWVKLTCQCKCADGNKCTTGVGAC